MNVLQVNYAFDRDLDSPDALLQRYGTLTGWSEAVAAAGAHVTVLQRFGTSATLARNGTDYVLCPSPNLHIASDHRAVDIVHVNGLIFARQSWSLRRVLPDTTAIVMQDHGSQPDDCGRSALGRARRALRRSALRAADAFLFVAPEQADAWRSAGLVAPDQRVYHVMEASTDVRPMPRDHAREMSGMTGTPAILWVGRLNANKDPLTVLAAFERSLTHLPCATMTMIYGEDDLLPQVVERVESSPALRERVRLVGRVEHQRLPAYYTAADIFVVGSHHEGSGYSLIEACACGCTPVVTDIPSFRVITVGGSIGALWMPGDAAGCAHALADVGTRDFERCRGAVLRHFERTLGWPVVGKRAVEIYREVVTRRRAARRAVAAH